MDTHDDNNNVIHLTRSQNNLSVEDSPVPRVTTRNVLDLELIVAAGVSGVLTFIIATGFLSFF